MVTVCVSSDALALLITKEELTDVRGAVRLSLESAGLEPWHDLEAEYFDHGGGGLLLARPRSPMLSRAAYRRRRRRAR